MPAGILKHFIHICREQTRTSDSGASVSLGYTRRHRKVPAGKVDVGGGEGPQGPRTEATVDSVFKIRWMRDVLETDRIEHDGAHYEIKRLADIDGNRQWLHISAVKLPALALAVEEAAHA